MGILIRDPLCGMQVEPDHYTIEYLQMHYAFCFRQCQERLRRAFVHYEEECEVGNLEVHEKSGVHRHHH